LQVADLHASDSEIGVVSPAYIKAVIDRMPTKDATLQPERRKELAEQKVALQRLERVMESRLRSDSSDAKDLLFSARLDDDEVLLRLMCEIEKGSTEFNGSISEHELLGSSMLNLEMKKALQAAFACNLEAMEEGLAHIDVKDFGEFVRTDAVDSLNWKASVDALFHALDPLGNGWIKKPGMVLLAENLKMTGSKELSSALSSLASTLPEDGVDLDFLAVKHAARRVPRATGQRMDWVRGMDLDAALARHLPPGTLEDGLAAVRALSCEEVKQAVAAFFEDAMVKIFEAVVKAKTLKGSRSAAEANG
jgi:hypothetical protein